jgi:hypothetical protein
MADKINLFDVVNLINEKKPYEWEEIESAYNSWMINHALSNHQQTVLFANECNKYYDLSKKQQFDFYYNAIPKSKRFGKWHKKVANSEDVERVSEYYCINNRLAEQYLSLLNEEQIQHIRKQTTRGGAR